MKFITAFRRLSLPYLRRHRLRTALTVLGVALGVAALVSLDLAYAPTTRAQERTLEKLSGGAVFEIENGDPGVPEALVDEIHAVEGVHSVAPSVQGFVDAIGRPGERVYLLGVDLVTDRGLHDYRFRTLQGPLDPLSFVARPDSVALTEEWMTAIGLELGDPLAVRGPSGRHTLRVRAVVDARDSVATVFQGRVALMDVFAAQRLFGLENRFSHVGVSIEPDAEPQAVATRLEEAVADRAVVSPNRARFQRLEQLLAAQQKLSTLYGIGALAVGLSVVFNALAISVVQRQKEIAVLRALGMERREVLRLILGEAAMIAAAGCALGVPLGLLLVEISASPLLSTLARAGVPPELPELRVELAPLGLAIALGMGTALVAALIPAVRAAGIHPLDALRRARLRPDEARPYLRAAVVGLANLVLAFALRLSRGTPFEPPVPAGWEGLPFMLGLVLLSPLGLRSLACVLAPFLGKRLGVAGGLAAKALAGNMGRFAITGTVLVICLGYVVEASAAYTTLRHTIFEWVDTVFSDADLLVSAGEEPLAERAAPLPPGLPAQLRSLEGVERVGLARIARVAYRGAMPTLFARDAASLEGRLFLLEGRAERAEAALARGKGVVVDETFARLFDVERGDELALSSPRGARALLVVGVAFTGRPREAGTVFFSLEHYRRMWGDRRVSLVEVTVAERSSPEAVARQIRARLGEDASLFVTAVGRLRTELESRVRRDMAAVPGVLALAVGIALLGLVNSLFAALLDRVGEIGVLRAVGATRRQIGRATLLEGALLGLLAGVLAGGVGSAIAWFELSFASEQVRGVTLFFREPVWIPGLVAGAAMLLAGTVAWLPGRQAAAVDVREALERE